MKKGIFTKLDSSKNVGTQEYIAPETAVKLNKPINEKLQNKVETIGEKPHTRFENLTKPTAAFTQALAREIVRNLTSFSELTSRPFKKSSERKNTPVKNLPLGDYPILLDTSILIDGRIISIVNSGFLIGTLIIPEIVLKEVQHIADSADAIRRAKGRRGLDVVAKLKGQKVNDRIKVKIIKDDPIEAKEVDHKLIALIKKWKIQGNIVRLMTIDFNLAQLARAQSIKVMNVNDLGQALKTTLIPGEELDIRITHEGKERQQGVGYLDDGTMVVVDDCRDRVGQDVKVVIFKVHQTPAGQLFFARPK